jgi:hypothetical protein
MDATVIPVAAAGLVAIAALFGLGSAGAARLWTAWRRGPSEPAWTPGPGIAGDRVDPTPARLAHRALGAALFLGVAASFFFSTEPDPGPGFPRAAVALGLIGVWAAALRDR